VRDNPEVRREQIIDEAIRIVGERGYYGFTVQELAQRCGLSNAGLLYHFGTKDQLLLEMLQAFERRETLAMAPLAALAESQSAPGESSRRALLDLFRTMVLRASTQPEMGRLYMVLQSETLDPAHPAHEGFRGREAITLELFAKIVAPYVAAPRSSARQLLALMDGLAQQWVREDQAFDLVAEWDQALATALPQLTQGGMAQPAKRGSGKPRAPRPATR
jgi:AcrR family transcriptional regulator